MIKDRRQLRILEILNAKRTVEIAELARDLPEVSQVTLRRDIAELAEAGALKRTHGGAVLPDAAILKPRPKTNANDAIGLEELDAVILPPLVGRGGDALRRQIARRGIPFLAESAPQAGGVYLGPNNFDASRELGLLAGDQAADLTQIRLLLIGQPDLENTRDRVAGFLNGLREVFTGPIDTTQINSQGSYRIALRVATDAFASSPSFNMVFAVNDHAAIAGIDAAERHGVDVRLYATGGENPEFVSKVANRGPLKAVAAFFPEVVGASAIDRMASAIADGGPLIDQYTPHAIITADNLDAYFAQSGGGWQLREDRRTKMVGNGAKRGAGARRARVGFMPHFPAHDWYRAMIQAMQARAAAHYLKLVLIPPHQGISAEISRLRIEIAKRAASTLVAGETVILGAGEATHCLAAEIRQLAFSETDRLSGLTVITNSLDVLFRLEGAPGIKTLLTSGEFQSADNCLVGPSLGALFERMRADRAYLSVAGVSNRFGISASDERLALADSRLCGAARRTIALADHTLIGAEANHRIARIEDLDAVITDDGAMPADRQSLRAAGVEVLVAGEDADLNTPQIVPAAEETARQT